MIRRGSVAKVRVLRRAGGGLRVRKALPGHPAGLVVHLHLARRLALRRRHLRMADSCAKTFQTMRQNVIHRARSFRTSDGHFAMFNVVSKRDALNFSRFALYSSKWAPGVDEILIVQSPDYPCSGWDRTGIGE